MAFRAYDTNSFHIKANIIGPLQTNVPTVLRDGSKDAPIFAQSAGDAVDQAWQAIGTDSKQMTLTFGHTYTKPRHTDRHT